MDFIIELAGRRIEIHSLYRQVVDLCADYLAEDESSPDICVRICPEDIEYERGATQDDGWDYPDDYLETLAVYRKICTEMLKYDTFLMHGAVIAKENEAYMFTAPSGTGKTTHIRLWLEHIEGCFVVNGDKPLIRICEDGTALACGTPWSGKESMNRNICVPLRAIFFLERGARNSVEELPADERFETLLRQTYRPQDPEAMVKTVSLLGSLCSSVRFFELKCNMEPGAALAAWSALGRNTIE